MSGLDSGWPSQSPVPIIQLHLETMTDTAVNGSASREKICPGDWWGTNTGCKSRRARGSVWMGKEEMARTDGSHVRPHRPRRWRVDLRLLSRGQEWRCPERAGRWSLRPNHMSCEKDVGSILVHHSSTCSLNVPQQSMTGPALRLLRQLPNAHSPANTSCDRTQQLSSFRFCPHPVCT